MYIVFLDIMLLHINRLQYSVNITFMWTGKPKNSCDSIVILALMQWSGTEPTVPPKNART